ncbi:MAG: EF-Tu/IF-2/RF-3 family GTPase [Candidatus Micrarchaeia archaeon]
MADAKNSFSFTILSVFSLPSGPVVAAKVETGSLKVGQVVQISGKQAKITKIELNNKSVSQANAGQMVGISLSGVKADSLIMGSLVKGA